VLRAPAGTRAVRGILGGTGAEQKPCFHCERVTGFGAGTESPTPALEMATSRPSVEFDFALTVSSEPKNMTTRL
jgi:hypothetical protein